MPFSGFGLRVHHPCLGGQVPEKGRSGALGWIEEERAKGTVMEKKLDLIFHQFGMMTIPAEKGGYHFLRTGATEQERSPIRPDI